MTSQSTDRSLCETAAARRPCVVVACNDNSAPIDNVSECKVSGCNIVPSLTHAGLSLSLSLSLSLCVCVCECVCVCVCVKMRYCLTSPQEKRVVWSCDVTALTGDRQT